MINPLPVRLSEVGLSTCGVGFVDRGKSLEGISCNLINATIRREAAGTAGTATPYQANGSFVCHLRNRHYLRCP